MNQEWQQFLSQQGATIEGGVVERFADRSAELLSASEGTILCDLSQFGTLRVSGEDAQSFLQNLLSNDIRAVDGAHAQLSSFNTPKGRMLASMTILRNGDDYLLQLPRALCEAMRKKLSMYVLRSKVKIADTSEVVSVGLAGQDAEKILTAQFGELPHERLAVAQADPDSPSIIRIGDTRFQINASVDQAQALWQKLCQKAQPVGSVCWDWLNIRAGIPVILPQTQEQFVPQMVNYDGVGGVSFKKGCYPGQEIVARMQYLGHLKRRMYVAHIDVDGAKVDTNEIPQAGDELFSVDMEGQATGMIVNAAPAPNGGFDVLAVAQIASRETQPVHWKSLQGAALQFLPTPYLPPDA